MEITNKIYNKEIKNKTLYRDEELEDFKLKILKYIKQIKINQNNEENLKDNLKDFLKIQFTDNYISNKPFNSPVRNSPTSIGSGM